MSLVASSPVRPQRSFRGHTRLAFRHKLDVLVPLCLQELQQEHGALAPHLDEDPLSECPLSSKRLVLMSLDRISVEDQPELQWWQVALALNDI